MIKQIGTVESDFFTFATEFPLKLSQQVLHHAGHAEPLSPP